MGSITSVRKLKAVLTLALLLCGGRVSRAQPASLPSPIYHGVLGFPLAEGKIDRATGVATLTVRHARLLLSPTSDGIFPDREPILVVLGANTFTLAAGMLKAPHGGKVLSYRAQRNSDATGIRYFRIWKIAGPSGVPGASRGVYGLRFALRGLNLARLNAQEFLCLPMEVIVGDDDGSLSAFLTSPSFQSERFSIPCDCYTSVGYGTALPEPAPGCFSRLVR